MGVRRAGGKNTDVSGQVGEAPTDTEANTSRHTYILFGHHSFCCCVLEVERGISQDRTVDLHPGAE